MLWNMCRLHSVRRPKKCAHVVQMFTSNYCALKKKQSSDRYQRPTATKHYTLQEFGTRIY